jgi:hypothetical protein
VNVAPHTAFFEKKVAYAQHCVRKRSTFCGYLNKWKEKDLFGHLALFSCII